MLPYLSLSQVITGSINGAIVYICKLVAEVRIVSVCEVL